VHRAQPEPFTIAMPQPALDDLCDRLARTRFADDFANDDWGFGMPASYLRELVGYWHDEYDWRAHEATMNRFAHFRADLDGIPIHFVHERGNGPAPIPIVLTHGWPWTFWDYEHLIGPLSDPAAHGGDPHDAFDVIVPSLPGTAFSSPLRTPGIGVTQTADLWVRLMRDTLGYDRFAVGGGDSGAFVSSWLGHAHAPHIVGVHLNFPAPISMAALGTIRDDEYAPDEDAWRIERAQARGTAAHMVVQTEDPQTLAYGMHDSPAALAAWIVARRWSDRQTSCTGR
jgi:pimeloyl-ACP methyl ester carboxylesterase